MLFKEKQTGLNHQTNRRTILKPWIISGVFLGVMFLVTLFNRGSNFLCRKKGHSKNHSNALM